MFIAQGEKIQTILKAAAVDVESYWPGLFAKALEGVNIKELITKIGSGVGSAPAGCKNRIFNNTSYSNSKYYIIYLNKFFHILSFEYDIF